MCSLLVDEGGALCGEGRTVDGGAEDEVDGVGDVDFAESRIEDVDGYCRRPAAPAAFAATLED
jgi:hypothetical protein